VLPAFWVGSADTLPENVDKARQDVKTSLVVQSIIGTAIFLLVAVLMREKPPTPPSSTESSRDSSFKQDVKGVF
jgi:putative copper export protein